METDFRPGHLVHKDPYRCNLARLFFDLAVLLCPEQFGSVVTVTTEFSDPVPKENP